MCSVRRLALFMVLVAFTFSCGGQWAVLQGVAWANMVREYSKMVPLSQAMEMTFSGHYPCALCKAIAERKQTEDAKVLSLHQQEKPICPAQLTGSLPQIAQGLCTFCPWEKFLQTRSEAPPTPPPRFA